MTLRTRWTARSMEFLRVAPGLGRSRMLFRRAESSRQSILFVAAVTLALLAPAAAPARTLLWGPSVSQPPTSSKEYLYLTGLGETVVVARNPPAIGEIAWPTTATGSGADDFDDFSLIVFGDGDNPTCAQDPENVLAAPISSAALWGGVVTGANGGNIIIIGTDPDNHYLVNPQPTSPNKGAGQLVIENGLSFARAQGSTKHGLYACLSCYYNDAPANTIVTLLDGLAGAGAFKVEGPAGGTCPMPNTIIKCVNHPALNGLTGGSWNSSTGDGNLSDWICSWHEGFDAFPSSYSVLGLADGVTTQHTCAGHTGLPYILVKGTRLVPADSVVGVNKDIKNTTGQNANDVEILLKGNQTVLKHYDGYAANFFSTFAVTTVSGNTLLHWSNPNNPVPPNGVAHLGFLIAGTQANVILGVSWTLDGNVTGCAKQVNTPHAAWGINPGNLVTYVNDCLSCESVPLYAGAAAVRWYSSAVDLDNLNAVSLGNTTPLRTDIIPDSPILIAPGDQASVAIPAAPVGAAFAVLSYKVGTSSGLNSGTETLDFVETPVGVPPPFCTKWGGSGSGAGQFNAPAGIAVNAVGEVYVADIFNHRIQKFSTTGAYQLEWGSLGVGVGQFDKPYGVAVSPGGEIYVVEYSNNRVQKFSATGVPIAQWGTIGNGNGQFFRPTGVATDAAGDVYVADFENHRIQKFNSGGAFLSKWGTQGSGNGQLFHPIEVAARGGYVYVADGGNNRIQKFTDTGTYVTQWGTFGSGDGQFEAPSGVATDADGYVYVADQSNNRIQKFTDTGLYVSQWGSLGSGDGQFDDPYRVTADPAGNVFVSDINNERIQKFGCAPVEVADVGDIPNSGSGIALAQNVPNPFSDRTTLAFRIDRAASVRLDVYDIAGRAVRRYPLGVLGLGPHHVEWDRKDAYGAAVPAGVYLYRLTVDGRPSGPRRAVVLN